MATFLCLRREEIEIISRNGGPKTQEGKEMVRWNAARHGIRSPAPVVPGIEKAEDWEEHSAGVLESLSLSGIPDDTPLDEFDSWTAALVRQGIEAIAERVGEEPQALLDAATESLRHTVEQAKTTAQEVERDLERMSQERLLPDEKTLEKISRYEAHLSRQLYKAMHELEALQTRRTGSAAPLARLDVDGMEG